MSIKSSTIIQTSFGPFKVSYHSITNLSCVSFSFGDITKGTPIVRFHSACLFGEAFHSLHCDCNHQLTETMRMIKKNGNGVIVYSYQEGRGIGLEKKIEAMEIERTTECDTVEAFKILGIDKPDMRDYKAEIEALKELNLSKTIHSFSGNPTKRKVLEDAGYIIKNEYEVEAGKVNEIALKEMKTKKDKLGYTYRNI